MSKRMGIARLAFAICGSLILAFCPCAQSKAVAVPMPILPYVPPETGQVLDYLLNANGLTAPAIEGEQNKLDAYLDLYKRALGAGWETAWNQILETIEKGKLSGKMEMSSDVVSAFGSAIAYGLQNGVAVGDVAPAVSSWQTLRERVRYIGVTMTDAQAQEIYAFLRANRQTGIYVAVDANHIYFKSYLASYGTPTYQTIWNNTAWWILATRSDGTLSAYPTGSVEAVFSVKNGVVRERTIYRSGTGAIEGWFPTWRGEVNTESASTTPIVAQTAEIGQSVTAGTVRALSAYTALNADGTIDATKPLVVPMPLVDVVPATTVDDLARVQDAQGVVPAVVGEDVASIVQGLQTAQGNVMDYNLTLANYFPFCIPFDLGNLVSRFVAEPVSPSFEWTFRNVDGTDIVKEISLEWLNPVMEVVRAGELLLAGIGLALLTPSLIKW